MQIVSIDLQEAIFQNDATKLMKRFNPSQKTPSDFTPVVPNVQEQTYTQFVLGARLNHRDL